MRGRRVDTCIAGEVVGDRWRELEELISTLSPAVQRHLRGARWMLGPTERKGNPELTWPELRNQLSDLALAAQAIVDEFPWMSRGTTIKVLQGRWLRQSATAIEKVAGAKITTKTSNAEGKDYRFEASKVGYSKLIAEGSTRSSRS